MKILSWRRSRWQFLLNIEIIYAILFQLYEGATFSRNNFWVAGELFLLLVLNYFQGKNKATYYLTICLNLLILPDQFCEYWAITGNNLLHLMPQVSILIILLLWLVWLVLLLPVAMVSASQIKNWFLRLIAFGLFLDVQYGSDQGLLISKNLPVMHSINNQGVVSAFALLILVCFLVHSWGFRFNPNLKFQPSANFSWVVYSVLILLLVINVAWNTFGGNGNNIFSILFSYIVDIHSKYIYVPSFTSALEPGVLEEAERYINIMILLIASRNLKKWRIPIAVYGSTLLFALPHFSNIGWNGQTVAATISQVLAVTDAMMWVAAYFYIGKLWFIMIVHFFNDYFINIQWGWNSPSTWTGDFNDWATTIIPLIFGLIVTIWMMYGKRRLVMEEKVDRLLGTDQELDFSRMY